MASSTIVLLVLATGVGAGAFIDLRTRRVPNILTGSLAALGIASAAAGVTGLTIQAAAIGLVLGMLFMMPGYLFGATGAGDVKLLAAVGAWLGPSHIGVAFLYTAVAGGVLALIVARRRRRLSRTLERAGDLIARRPGAVGEIEKVSANNRFAYAPAIAAGSILAAVGM